MCYWLLDELGKRLEDAGGEFSSCAEICYIASGNIAPLINKRLSGASVSTENIQVIIFLAYILNNYFCSFSINFML